jgi:hypothetical protein
LVSRISSEIVPHSSVDVSHDNIRNCENNITFCSPYRNFQIQELEKLSKIDEKKSNCGMKSQVFIDTQTLDSIEFPIYCDNRLCSLDGCKNHRAYKFRREH